MNELDAVAPPGAGQGAASRRELFGHPRGLVYLVGTEFWDRVSFHGMQALLVLYMVEQLLLPGHVEHVAGFAGFRALIEAVTGPLSTRALATQIFGLYIGLVYFTPVLGGLLGDRVLGRRRTVILGASLMTAGHFSLAFERSFLLALLLLILGAGCLRGNLISQVGDLYAKGDRRRGDGIQLYYAMLNCGAFVAPVVSGLLGQTWGWHYGFGFAGFGMLAGLIFYVSGRAHLPADPLRLLPGQRIRLDAAERRRVTVLCCLLPVLSCFWIAQTQVWNAYNLWARDHVDMVILGWSMPVPWLQSVDGLAPMAMMPLVVWLWRRQAARGREPDEFAKMSTGCLLFGAGMAWLAAGDLVAGALGRVPLAWALVFHLISNVGWLFFTPIVLALYSRVAPASVNALMIGIYMLSIFVGSTIAGRLGGLYEQVSAGAFWLIHGAIVAGGGIVLLALAGFLRREFTMFEPAAADPRAMPVRAEA
jgi:POT family proton-dependent oligopeptide transporter